MYYYVVVLQCFYTAGFSFDMALFILTQVGTTKPSVEKFSLYMRIVWLILQLDGVQRRLRIRTLSVLKQKCLESLWRYDFEIRKKSTSFEHICLERCMMIFLVLFGTRATDNQVKLLDMRKADKEWHSTDTLVDHLFCVIQAMQFCRHSEAQMNSVRKRFGYIMDGRRYQAHNR